MHHNKYDDLICFDWNCVVEELCYSHTYLADILLAASLPQKLYSQSERIGKLTRHLGMVYSILMKSRLKDLSRAQRVISMTLLDEKAHQKVNKHFLSL